MALVILPKHIWEKIPVENAKSYDYPDHPEILIGSGPVKFVSAKMGEYIEYEAWEQYHGGGWREERLAQGLPTRIYMDKLVLRSFVETEPMIAALRKGEIDAIAFQVPPIAAEELKKDPNIHVDSGAGSSRCMFVINVFPNATVNPTLRDKNVRQAMQYAIDKKKVVDMTMLGYGDVSSNFMVPAYGPYYNPNLEPYPYDPDKARTILDGKGYRLGDNGIRVSPDGVELEYELLVPTGNPVMLRMSETAADYWKEIGIKVNLKNVEESMILYKIGNYTNELVATQGETATDPSWVTMTLTSQLLYTYNMAGFVNKEYDRLWEEQNSVMDIEQRKDAINKMMEILQDESPVIMISSYDIIAAWRTDKWTGYTDHDPGMTDKPGGTMTCLDMIIFNDIRLKPATTTEVTTTVSGQPGASTQWIVGAAIVVVVAALGAYLYLRRRK
jgi:peptide/nickel transport system substrate-binding protein